MAITLQRRVHRHRAMYGNRRHKHKVGVLTGIDVAGLNVVGITILHVSSHFTEHGRWVLSYGLGSVLDSFVVVMVVQIEARGKGISGPTIEMILRSLKKIGRASCRERV